jgi:hypothetical protein
VLDVDFKWLANASAISFNDILIINFELNKRVILPFKIRNILPEVMGIGFKDVIYKC